MHKIIIFSLLLIQFSFASKSIPLKQKDVYVQDKNNQQYVDTVLYSTIKLKDVGATKATIEQSVVFDTLATKNYVITKETKQNNKSTNKLDTILCPEGIDCSGYCNGEGAKSILDFQYAEGGKAQLKGGQELPKKIEIDNFKVQTLNLYFPNEAYASLSQYYQVLKDVAHVGLGLAYDKSVENIFDKFSEKEELVEENTFSIYAHEEIAQLVIGKPEKYFIQPDSKGFSLKLDAYSNQKGWSVLLSGLKQNEKDIDLKGQQLRAYFDSTTKYIYVPFIKGDEAKKISNYNYFMNAFTKCFKTTTPQIYSFRCPKDQFKWDDYENITFQVVDLDGKTQNLTLKPEDYIEELDENYELLFVFIDNPQKQNTFYLGTTFLKKYYTLFDQKNGQVTIYDKYHVNTSVGGLALNNSYRIPFIILGCLLALAAIIILLLILKRIKIPDAPFMSTNVIPAYQRGTYQQQGYEMMQQPNENVKRAVFNQDVRQSNRPVGQNIQYVTQSPIQRYQQQF